MPSLWVLHCQGANAADKPAAVCGITALPPYGIDPATPTILDGHTSAGHLCQCLILVMPAYGSAFLYDVVWFVVNDRGKLLQREQDNVYSFM